MNFMSREMRTQSRELHTQYRVDASGLIFVSCSDPRASLSFKLDSETLQDDITAGVRGLLVALGEPIDDVQLIRFETNEFVWLVTSPAYERVLQVA